MIPVQDRARALLDWYAAYGRRALPWRRTRDPYRVLVSEFMLQQTQVDRVIPLYDRFVERFPTFDALAAGASGDVLRLWRGLGYNSRALRLHDLAIAVVALGELPRDRDRLLALPGIGPYTASAVRAFAFDYDDAAMDTNLRRVVHRTLYGLEHPPLATPAELDRRATQELPSGAGHDWNSAMMDLGATICTARAPKCLICPLQPWCVAAPIDVASLGERARTHAPRRSPQESLPFERTTRFLRGRIVDRLRDLPGDAVLSVDRLVADLTGAVPADRLVELVPTIEALERERILTREESGIRLR